MWYQSLGALDLGSQVEFHREIHDLNFRGSSCKNLFVLSSSNRGRLLGFTDLMRQKNKRMKQEGLIQHYGILEDLKSNSKKKIEFSVFGFIEDVITKTIDYHLFDVVVEFHREIHDLNFRGSSCKNLFVLSSSNRGRLLGFTDLMRQKNKRMKQEGLIQHYGILEDLKSNSIEFHRCSLEEGLTIVKGDGDMNKLYDVAEKYGLISLYIAHLPKNLAEYYYKNLTLDASDEEEQQKAGSPYLRTPPLKPRRKGIEFPCKNLFGDFSHCDSVADEVVLHDNLQYEGLALDGYIEVGGSSKHYDLVHENVVDNGHSLPNMDKERFSNNVVLNDVVTNTLAYTLSLVLKKKYRNKVNVTRKTRCLNNSKTMRLRKGCGKRFACGGHGRSLGRLIGKIWLLCEQMMKGYDFGIPKRLMTDPAWIESMQEDASQFKRLDVSGFSFLTVYHKTSSFEMVIQKQAWMKRNSIGSFRLFLAYVHTIVHCVSNWNVLKTLSCMVRLKRKEVVVCHLKEGFIDADHPSHVYKLKKKDTIWAQPTEKHPKEVKRIFCYLRGTVNMGLWYTKDSGFELTGFFRDADLCGM
ncbi:hypothetical protein Tco_1385190 [Tanacetum coccineum]